MQSKNMLAPYLFHQGTNYKAYEYMGVHRTDTGFVFRVWAPNAERVFVVGDFNGWTDQDPMNHITQGGIWETVITEERAKLGDKYKYKIIGSGKTVYKSDPYGVLTECPPKTATVIGEIGGYEWRDDGWLTYRRQKAGKMYAEPMNIYELHIGSWKRHEDGSYYTYGELARELAPYVKQMGYTHVELMPVMEHPFDGSWGYQVCSYYAPTARFGTPRELMGFVDSMHEAGIGVILDWVPAHFPKDEHGLYEFDGRPLYEYQGYDRMEHAGWGTRRFDVGRNEVESFLVSNAMFWVENYHVDGLRVDAVASMLYLDYDKAPGEWVPNVYGDHRCLEAIAFFRKLNSCIKEYHPDVLMIAEESTAWANVTGFENEGLGFDMKWNMGWMNDTLSYAELDPIYRKYHHEKLTFSMTYAFGEHYILPISHDEVVHLKKSYLDKMSGDYWQKFASARAFAGYMMTHPGKKLSFMGNEIGQFAEWSSDKELDWFLLEYESHAKYQRYISCLNHLYLKTPALWQIDDSWDGFQWIDADNRDHSLISYRRIDKKGDEVIVVINFTPVAREEYPIGVPVDGIYEEIFNSDDESFGGSGVINTGNLRAVGQPENYLPASLRLRIPPLGMSVLRCKKKTGKTVSDCQRLRADKA
ncbi:MAG: 1,4-alpha-glucan branching protein GlgB [Clostridia bacterium]|nr:1,4-alpha-glucan branching protein GlgB [Clostridia bacterium]